MTRRDMPFLVASEVADAIERHRPVVALGSAIISHGMPYPDNVATALSLEEIVRSEGAMPATVAVIAGRIRIGLKASEIERLGNGGEPVEKVSLRDLPIALSQGGAGATTVAATLVAARLAGIRVLATGGIGGVHRGAQQSFDVSADLTELSRSSVAVVCAGADAILDLGLTLEVLETLGVPVLGYQTESFPAFYSVASPFGVDVRVESPEEAARICHLKWVLGLEGAVVVANPIPPEHALDETLVDRVLADALMDAHAAGTTGKLVTPFLVARINELTGGMSLKANVAVMRNNAALAARIAVALEALAPMGS